MLAKFEEMPDHSRIWIYQASRSLTDQEVSFVKDYTERFLSQWQAHGQDLKAAYKIEYDQFLIITVDESFSLPSGCSIDSSVHLIKALEKELGISFMTSGQVAFLMEDSINLFPFNSLKEQVSHAVINPETKVFDNTVKNLAEFNEQWLVPSDKTWVARYFK